MFAFRVLKSQWRYELIIDYSIDTGIIRGCRCGNEFVSLERDGLLMLSTGYQWDGPSGPTIDTPDFMRASLVHDALYQLIRDYGLSKDHRKRADDLFYDILIEDKMPLWRAWYAHLAVRLFGWLFV